MTDKINRGFLKNREMQTVVRNQASVWCPLFGGVPQGSVLAPVMLTVYVDNVMENMSSYVSLLLMMQNL